MTLASLASWLPPALALTVLAGAVYLWVSERLPPDLTALLAMVALLLTGVLPPEEVFAGFSHPATLSVAAMLVLSAGLEHTGAVGFLARRVLAPLGRSEFLLTAVLMVVVGTTSAFMNNTALVAVFIPVVLDVCRRTGARPGKVMMPMAHAATFGGMCTLIGTSTNVVGHEFALEQGLGGFGMFEFAHVGLPLALAGIAYVLVVGRWFLPASAGDLAKDPPRPGDYRSEVVVLEGCPWIGRRARPERFQRDHEVELLAILRGGRELAFALPWPRFRAGDRLHVRGPLESVLALENLRGIELHRPAVPKEPEPAAPAPEGTEAEAEAEPPAPEEPPQAEKRELIVLPRSRLIGNSLRDLRFADRFGAVVLALHRPGEPLHGSSETVPIRVGDVLVVEGTRESLDALVRTRGILFIGAPTAPSVRPHKVWIALLVTIGVVATVAFDLAPIVVAATAGCAVLMLAGCLEPREAYRAIDLGLVFLLAGALALGQALEQTGVTRAIGHALAGLGGGAGPYALLAGFFLAAAVVSELMSNSGTVLLLGPVALTTAEQVGLNPTALLAAIVFGASAAFAMPIGYQTSLMILGPGGYRVRDFVRMGVPLDLILAGLAVWLIPRHWPL
jgi:di/tricarboxylate transporter